ncbi:hypothetical protein ACP4OV_006433 [Aristida adscensionis]
MLSWAFRKKKQPIMAGTLRRPVGGHGCDAKPTRGKRDGRRKKKRGSIVSSPSMALSVLASAAVLTAFSLVDWIHRSCSSERSGGRAGREERARRRRRRRRELSSTSPPAPLLSTLLSGQLRPTPSVLRVRAPDCAV